MECTQFIMSARVLVRISIVLFVLKPTQTRFQSYRTYISAGVDGRRCGVDTIFAGILSCCYSSGGVVVVLRV